MDIVIDTNVIFSGLIKDGITRELLLMDEIHLMVPEYFYRN